jgi:hypothetical protein
LLLLTILNAAAHENRLPDILASARFIHDKIVVTNHNDYSWTDCSVDVNPDNVQSWFAVLHVALGAHEVIALEPKQFTTPLRDVIWNPRTQPPISVRIVCSIPDGSRSATVIPIR